MNKANTQTKTLPENILNNFLNNFPNIELFYKLTYKKVSNYNLILAIPQGNKCFIWFTKVNGNKMAVLINIENYTNYVPSQLLNNNFNNELVNTIIYGTSFNYENKLYFSMEDLFYYKKMNIKNSSFLNKLNMMNDILENNIYKVNDYENSVIIGIPPIHTNYSGLNNILEKLPYEINELKYILSDETHTYVKYRKNIFQKKEQPNKINNTNKAKMKIFKVVPQTKTDIYNLYLLNEITNEYEFNSVAFIPDYKTSIIMNKLFHGLAEHDNLDYLEDSDDEFADETNIENNWKMMECIFNNKFKKWIPIKVFE